MFKKATKKQAKLRCAVFGPSGAGKTFSALSIAQGMGDKIALIDTERGSASKYADRFNFDVCELEDQTIDGYVEAIGNAANAGYEVLVIDSLSHAWKELLQEVEQIAKMRYRGNTWSAWSEGTPKQLKLVNAILQYPGHVFATMRSKTEWQTEQVDGKNRPVRVGLAPEQGKGIEYEFDLLMEVNVDHIASVLKDRTGKFQDKLINKPGAEFGGQLLEWLNDGEAIKLASDDQVNSIEALIGECGADINNVYARYHVNRLQDLTAEKADDLIGKLKKQANKAATEAA